MFTRLCLTLGVVALLLAGCLREPPPTPIGPADSGGSGTVAAPEGDGSAPVAEPATPAEPATSEPAPGEPAIPVVGPELNPAMPDQPSTPPEESSAEPAEPATGDTERVKAEAGVGKRGRSLDPHEGLIVTPAKAYFTVRERLVFETQVPAALKLYEAATGNAPKSQEEFMTKVIEENKIELPELPAGQRYVWDPETKELMVERPAQ